MCVTASKGLTFHETYRPKKNKDVAGTLKKRNADSTDASLRDGHQKGGGWRRGEPWPSLGAEDAKPENAPWTYGGQNIDRWICRFFLASTEVFCDDTGMINQKGKSRGDYTICEVIWESEWVNKCVQVRRNIIEILRLKKVPVWTPWGFEDKWVKLFRHVWKKAKPSDVRTLDQIDVFQNSLLVGSRGWINIV